MTCTENVIKNIANEITRECQVENVSVDTEFVMYFIDLFFLNPKYGNMFSKTINRRSLEYFVKTCVNMIIRGETSVNTLKMQFIMQTNYDKLQNLIDQHLDSITECLRPLVNEIMDEDPQLDDEAAFMKLFRKISIYIILCSGLGNPGYIVTLKEGMAALESVFSLEELKIFVTLPRNEKTGQLNELMQIVSGVRLFNRDCKKGGEGIPDLPFKIVDASKACIASLSNALIAVMQRINTLTTAVDDIISIQQETGNIVIVVMPGRDLTEQNYKQIFELLAFNRQYEMFIRKLLADVEVMQESSGQCVERFRVVLEELHAAVKYKAAVPVATVYPMFKKLWAVWRGMQNIMYLLSTVNRLMSNLGLIQDQMKIPYNILDMMLQGKHVVTDWERMNVKVTVQERLSLGSLDNYVSVHESTNSVTDKTHVQYLGFCAVCLCVGALIPGNTKLGLIKWKGHRYAFCDVKMAKTFSKDPQRYVNEVLDFARNNPYIVNLLDILEEVTSVKHIQQLVTKIEPKTKVSDKDIQTETHPIDAYIEKDYSWDLWEWKRRACQWATIVNCRTHSTQTNYSHMRSEIQCQTTEPRDKCLQTKQDAGINTNRNNYFIWGLRGQVGYGQHYMDIAEKSSPDKKQAQEFTVCTWPCVEPNEDVCNTSILVNEFKHFIQC